MLFRISLPRFHAPPGAHSRLGFPAAERRGTYAIWQGRRAGRSTRRANAAGRWRARSSSFFSILEKRQPSTCCKSSPRLPPPPRSPLQDARWPSSSAQLRRPVENLSVVEEGAAQQPSARRARALEGREEITVRKKRSPPPLRPLARSFLGPKGALSRRYLERTLGFSSSGQRLRSRRLSLQGSDRGELPRRLNRALEKSTLDSDMEKKAGIFFVSLTRPKG